MLGWILWGSQPSVCVRQLHRSLGPCMEDGGSVGLRMGGVLYTLSVKQQKHFIFISVQPWQPPGGRGLCPDVRARNPIQRGDRWMWAVSRTWDHRPPTFCLPYVLVNIYNYPLLSLPLYSSTPISTSIIIHSYLYLYNHPLLSLPLYTSTLSLPL